VSKQRFPFVPWPWAGMMVGQADQWYQMLFLYGFGLCRYSVHVNGQDYRSKYDLQMEEEQCTYNVADAILSALHDEAVQVVSVERCSVGRGQRMKPVARKKVPVLWPWEGESTGESGDRYELEVRYVFGFDYFEIHINGEVWAQEAGQSLTMERCSEEIAHSVVMALHSAAIQEESRL